MQKEWPKEYKNYVLVIAFSAALVVVAQFLYPENILITTIAGSGIPGAVWFFLAETWKQNRHQEYALELQYKQQDYLLASSSHMAQVVYNKHVEFCDSYVQRLEQGLDNLFKDGPSKSSFDIGYELRRIRKNYSPWVTESMASRLKQVEDALIEIGSIYLTLNGVQSDSEREKMLNVAFNKFRSLLQIPTSDGVVNHEIEIHRTIEYVRNVLGVNELTDMRTKITQLALKRLNQ